MLWGVVQRIWWYSASYHKQITRYRNYSLVCGGWKKMEGKIQEVLHRELRRHLEVRYVLHIFLYTYKYIIKILG